MSATAGIPMWSVEDSMLCLAMLNLMHEEICEKYMGEQAKRELVSVWLTGYPYPSWEHIVDLLKRLENKGRGRVGAAKEAEEKYLKSKLCDVLCIQLKSNLYTLNCHVFIFHFSAHSSSKSISSISRQCLLRGPKRFWKTPFRMAAFLRVSSRC